MALIRWILSWFVLGYEWWAVRGLPAPSRHLDDVALYQFRACPFCAKVRIAMRRMGVSTELRDALQPNHEKALIEGGGERQVPCLRIQEPSGVRWMYESDAIIAYLGTREVSLSKAAAPAR